ncbi:MAG TPA: UDP-N-acetylmuramoyl-tripeptide--D-alanyl-D-alanine ligase [Clostridiales bacterium]|nr:UDP-N-acetylmuramoyl-tripeptide--D-alanyl-D-alanine ligase [Clostridiales bacterium]
MEIMNVKQAAKAVKGTIIHGDTDIYISSVSTNSKELENGALFVPIVGEVHDAHDFIEDAYKHGAVACFTSKDDVYHEGIVCIKVEDTLRALQDLASYYRNQFDISLIGITGSVGKTTTKEMISAALATKYKTLKTAGNMNSQVGLPLMMLRIEKEHDIAVIEMGISQENEMQRLSSIARPDLSVLINIGVSHIEQLKTKENIRKEKLCIINNSKEDSYLFINGDDPLLRDIKDNKYSQNSANRCLYEKTQAKIKTTKVITFGIKDNFAYRAKNIRFTNGKTYFTLINSLEHTEDEIVLNTLGEHNVNNALCALAIANYYNIPTYLAKKGLEEYRPLAMRGEIKKVNGITIIDDTYNASPDSMKSGIDVLLSLRDVKRKIAVLADVLELGSLSQKCHKEVGIYISDKDVDELITIGSQAKFIAQGVSDNNKDIIINSFKNNEEAIGYLKETIKTGDAMLVKGSPGMKTEELVNAFL